MTDIDDDQVTFRPIEGPQRQALASKADVVIMGGAAGGSKTATIVAGASRGLPDVNGEGADPGWSACILRRTFPELDQEGGPIKQAIRFYPGGAEHYNSTKARFGFPSGASVKFSHLQYESDRKKHKGAEYTYIGFDQLESFSQDQFEYLLGRLRSPQSSHQPHAICSCNPAGPDHWLFKLLKSGGWLEPTGEGQVHRPDPEMAGELRWREQTEDGTIWHDDPNDAEGPAVSYTFIPADASDNPYLSEQYLAQLSGLSGKDRAEMLEGLWGVEVSDRPLADHHIQIVDERPDDVTDTVRYWDLASSEDGSHTASVAGAQITREWTICLPPVESAEDDCDYFEPGATEHDTCPACGRDSLDTRSRDVLVTWGPVWFQLEGDGRDRRMERRARQDGSGVKQWHEQQPGAAGKDVSRDLDTAVFEGVRSEADKPTGDKRERMKLWRSKAETGRLWVVDGDRVADFIAAIEKLEPMDLADALSGLAKVASDAADEQQAEVFFV